MILYQDDCVAALMKPSGLATHRGLCDDGETALDVMARALRKYVYPVHRLDRGASGVLLFALTKASARFVHEQFEDGRAKKKYLAIARGIAPESGLIDHPIPRSDKGERVRAVTAYRRLHTFERYSVLEVVPETGRMHQIRRHLKHISHPLIGDVNYGKGEHNRYFREQFGFHRLALHASQLSLVHPNGTALRIDAPLPVEFKTLLRRVGYCSPGGLDDCHDCSCEVPQGEALC